MDHLPYPVGRNEHSKVRAYTNLLLYEPGDFFDLPQNQLDCSLPALLHRGLPWIASRSSVNEFLQSWLFFALLSEVTATPIRAKEFVDSKAGFINTTKLPHILGEWSSREKAESLAVNSCTSKRALYAERWLRISLALDNARLFVRGHCAVPRIDTEPCPIGFPYAYERQQMSMPMVAVDETLLMSLMVMGETLQQALTDICDANRHSFGFLPRALTQPNTDGWGYSRQLRNEMLEKGFCRAKMLRLETSMPRVSAIYYARTILDNDPAATTHDSCSVDLCRSRREELLPIHRGSCSGDCARCSTEKYFGDIEQWIQRGLTPLANWDSQSGLTIKPYDINDTALIFGALSHSWAERVILSRRAAELTKDRKMHVCQLEALQDIFDKLVQGNARSDAGCELGHSLHIPFWVDVLCMPRDKEAKVLATAQFKQIYANAEEVLVWDRTLLQQTECRDYASISSAIRLADRSRSLWGLQEALLARNPHFEFGNGTTVTLKSLHTAYLTSYDDPMNHYHFCLEATSPFDQAAWSLRKRQDTNYRPGLLKDVWTAIQPCLLHRPEEETIILANYLKLNTSALQFTTVAEELADARMKKFLHMVAEAPHLGLPSDIIFLPQGREPLSGCEWGSKTWLGLRRQGCPGLTLPTLQHRPTMIIDNEIIVEYPGLLIDFTQQSPIERGNRNCEHFWVRMLPYTNIWHELVLDVREWGFDAWKHSLSLSPSLCNRGRLCVILSADPKTDWTQAIIVRILQEVQNDDNMFVVQRLCRAGIRLETNSTNATILESMVLTRQITTYPVAEKLSGVRKWLIRGEAQPHERELQPL